MDSSDSMFEAGFLANVYSERPIDSTPNAKVVTRFPPEPNGHLHIGHSKAIAINFGFARYHGGACNLRFDDTNPMGEKAEFFEAIEEMVKWLGFTPDQVTYSSDRFDDLYNLAEQLIIGGSAYVCHCSTAEVQAQRGGGKGCPRYPCPHRDRPSSQSLLEFRGMRDGEYRPQEVALRLKQNLEDGNPQMWDLTAYRVLDSKYKHHRTGDKWRIYPTYDFTHCLCDSLEGITHSLCTTEFELSRVSYNWLCDQLKVYTPMQREYGRLNLTGTVLSKRKIQQLVEENHVRGWDDPRLYTLVALRRRGVPPGAILAFVNELGVTKGVTNIDIKRFEQTIRGYLESTVPRLMLVPDPILVIIDNLSDDHLEMLEVPFAKEASYGTHLIPFTKRVYIDRSDFREEASKDYFRLAPRKSVGLLKVPYPILATSFERDATTSLKPKTSSNPDGHPDGFIADLNPNSEEKYSNAYIEVGFDEVRRRAPWPNKDGEAGPRSGTAPGETVRFQGTRVGYFCVDKDSTVEQTVLNRIVSLKEDSGKADGQLGRVAELPLQVATAKTVQKQAKKIKKISKDVEKADGLSEDV
ncbi:MAG: hypothetical protein M1817_001436 [Caeruleum heppii]|nr:MAG: hypothetical protein M1817_001436 [Caeruleum heppii]